MAKIWIVCGETGEYDDHSEWNIVAYRDEMEALDHVEEAQALADKYDYSDYSNRDNTRFRAHMGKLDPIGCCDGPVDYNYYPLILREP